MPKFPYPTKGACELERATGLEQFISLGFEVYLISKIYNEKYLKEVQETSRRLGITIVPVVYKYLNQNISFLEKFKKGLLRFIRPWYLDGAAFEYSDPEIKKEVKKALDIFRPDFAWFEYTYLWPLYGLIRRRRIPIITRSHNFEPLHFLDEDGHTLINYIKSIIKYLSERIVCRKSDVIFAITPKEEKIYKKLGAKNVYVLPQRVLPQYLNWETEISDRSPLNVFFFGSTYNVAHNKAALEFLLKKIIPRATEEFPGKFSFHIFGSKIPADLEKYFVNNIVNHNYVSAEELNKILKEMDIALIPSLYGAGMQQKVFEPLVRGFPVITSERVLAGYPFKDREHLLLASTEDDFVKCLGDLLNKELRQRLSHNAKELSKTIFSEEVYDKIIKEALEKIRH